MYNFLSLHNSYNKDKTTVTRYSLFIVINNQRKRVIFFTFLSLDSL